MSTDKDIELKKAFQEPRAKKAAAEPGAVPERGAVEPQPLERRLALHHHEAADHRRRGGERPVGGRRHRVLGQRRVSGPAQEADHQAAAGEDRQRRLGLEQRVVDLDDREQTENDRQGSQ